MASDLSVEQLIERLRRSGFGSSPDENLPNVWPTPDRIISIGDELDCTLNRQYRNHFFSCIKDADGRAVISRVTKFAFRNRSGMVIDFKPLSAFADGAVRWLSNWLTRYREILYVWPETKHGGLLWADEHTPEPASECARRWIDERRTMAAAIPQLDLDRDHDLLVLLGLADWVGCTTTNIYVADHALNCVFLMHHHDKLVVDCRGEQRRQALISDLRSCEGCFQDCSHYECESDSELFE